jgi:hypothetical protein
MSIKTKIGFVRAMVAHLRSRGVVVKGRSLPYAASLLMEGRPLEYCVGLTDGYVMAVITGEATEAMDPSGFGSSGWGSLLDDAANVEAYLVHGRVG